MPSHLRAKVSCEAGWLASDSLPYCARPSGLLRGSLGGAGNLRRPFFIRSRPQPRHGTDAARQLLFIFLYMASRFHHGTIGPPVSPVAKTDF